jgi:hypothetical protein
MTFSLSKTLPDIIPNSLPEQDWVTIIRYAFEQESGDRICTGFKPTNKKG